MLLEPRMVGPFPEVKDKNQDTKATNIHLVEEMEIRGQLSHGSHIS